MSRSPIARRLLVAGLSLALAPVVLAEQEVRFSNSSEAPVRLQDNSTVVLDQNWNFDAECVRDPDNTCTDFPKDLPGAGTPPAMAFTASPLATAGPVTAGVTDITLGATVSGARVCERISNPVTTSWTGFVVPPVPPATFKIPTSPVSSPWTFKLVCYGDGGSTLADGDTEGVDKFTYTVEQPVTPPPSGNEPNCNIAKESITDPTQRALFKPAGFLEREITWRQLFPHPTAPRVYPDSFGDKIPVGSKTFHQPDLGNAIIPVKGLYLSIPFVRDSTFHQLSHRPATSALDWYMGGTYSFEAAKSVYITISPCKGDFRTTSSSTAPPGDESFKKACRKQFTSTEDLFYGAGTSCALTPGNTYYINIVFESISDNVLDPNTTSCADEFFSDGTTLRPQDHICDAGLQHD